MRAMGRGALLAVVVTVVVAGCDGQVTPTSTASQSGSPGAANGPAVSQSPTAMPAGAAVMFDYLDLRDMARDTKGVALVQVTSIGELQYNTADGLRPAEGTPLSGSISVGRIVEVRLVRLVKGAWVAGDVARYWQPGGTIGADTAPSEGWMGLPRPELGGTMVAFLTPQPADLDPTDAQLFVDVIALFPVADSGRVITPDPQERVQADRLEDAVR
ncbi:MAG: hypothetical protein ACR2KI_06500 [Candidatus Limnocylindria bacterium]